MIMAKKPIKMRYIRYSCLIALTFIQHTRRADYPPILTIVKYLSKKRKGIDHEIFSSEYLRTNSDVRMSQTLHILCYGFRERRSGIKLSSAINPNAIEKVKNPEVGKHMELTRTISKGYLDPWN